jgi:Glucoamylase and related glycosyl hydrolases
MSDLYDPADCGYPAIANYALIGDCHSVALVGRSGSIDWCCMPCFDSDSCFGRLLDWEHAGYCAITPAGEYTTCSREYQERTLVLVTTFRTPQGEARLIDFFAMRRGGRTHPRRQLLRILEGVSGRVDFAVEVIPLFDYGAISPWIKRHSANLHTAVASNQGLIISGDVPLTLEGKHALKCNVKIGVGDRLRLSIQFAPPELLEEVLTDVAEHKQADRYLEETVAWWHNWSSKISASKCTGVCVLRSAIVLKALGYAPTGAIIAAPTTSLPESPGGERNWDYRFSWLRDSIFTVHALADLGCESEADGFRRFIQRSAAGSADELQVVYGVDGRRRLTEIILHHLRGYCDARPVRIGNAADHQFQGDMYGLILEQAWRWSERGNSPDPHYWKFLAALVEAAAARWQQPDHGIWEVRCEPKHFVHSKVMCWAALNRGIALAQQHTLKAPLKRWQRVKQEIHDAVETHGYDHERGVYVQAFGGRGMDAALLLLPDVEFIPYQDERMRRTVDAVWQELDEGGLLLRYRMQDGLHGHEGAFLACTFWLAECLARQNRKHEAKQVYERATHCANDLGLFSEQYDMASAQMRGNFPQGLSHLSHISAALALQECGAMAACEQ